VDAKDDIENLINDFKGLFAGVLQPLLKLLGTLTPAQLQAIFLALSQAPDLATLLQIIESAFPPPPPGGTSLGQLMSDSRRSSTSSCRRCPTRSRPGLGGPDPEDRPDGGAAQKLQPVLKIFAEVMDELSPGTSIRIQPSEIRITTGKATIELKGEDIEIKAKGKVTIEGSEVCISPSPCKCRLTPR